MTDDALWGAAVIALLVVIWNSLSGFAIGRFVQFAIASLAYGAWFFGTIWLAYMTFFVFPTRPFGSVHDAGGFVFAAVVTIILVAWFLAQLAIPLMLWNWYTRFAHDKAGLALPQVRDWMGYRP